MRYRCTKCGERFDVKGDGKGRWASKKWSKRCSRGNYHDWVIDYNVVYFDKTQTAIIRKIKRCTNKQLLEETLSLAMGNDHEGGFTPIGLFEYEMLNKELHKRLKYWLKK